MANLFPESRILLAALVVTLAAAANVVAQDAPALQPDMPITIDAESSEFDYASSRLVFRGLRLDQGNLGIRADVVETDKLDFAQGEWHFRGNVLVEADTTRLQCADARLRFRDHQLLSATLTGTPASFAQPAPDSDRVNTGAANEIMYDMQNGTLQLVGAARFSDGINEVSGDLITYDLTRGRLTAGSSDNGPVRILIEPPAREEGATASP
ncbi:MAG: hypothetical protein HKN56_07790 [Gammaproteobacteria bacterium]|nr:hypothetical protein [Gammaproteobacteria bacterium]NND54855.1 hypothetical protein [Gammaproteobacteria bacterium]